MKTNAIRVAVRSGRGFTLIEVLVVLVIVMGLAGIVSLNVVRHQAESKVKTAQLQISQLEQALQSFYLDHGRYPTQAQGLQALVTPPAGLADSFPEGGYLARPRVPVDPWGQPYIYLIPGRQGERFEILSYGSDREPGGTGHGADISSRDL
jgi:general secretion pathway protein G